eukprot:PITA_33643
MIIHLDLTKAYDKLSWSYIREVLKTYGFDHNWIRWVMALVTTASFSILLNGSLSRTFRPSRGLRQGDPLSTFLFILMMEGLGKAIKSANAKGRIQGLKLTRNGDTLTHQQFVDDTMLQGTPTVKEAKAFKQILNAFAMATGTEKHSFWEIRDGNLTWFWEDSLQQEPNLCREGLDILKNDTDNKGLLRVSDFWDQTRGNGKWRTWRDLVYNEETPLKAQAEALAVSLEQRKILTSTSSDQLRWGSNSEGNFNLKEAKIIAIGLDFPNPDKMWKDLRQNLHWMKIKLFMWLVHQKKYLTWENLRKRGLACPSRCQLCGLQEESMDHLLNLCAFTSTLWNWVASIFKQTDRDENSISGTLKNWRNDFSENETVNKAWTLIPGSFIWDVWKERNNRIFKNRIGSTQSIMAQI